MSLLLAIAILIAGHGAIPIPTPPGSEPFPCQQCGCGCATAEHCWSNCCCYTPAERLAWAAANGVEPPERFRGSLLAQAIAQSQVEKPAPTCDGPTCDCGGDVETALASKVQAPAPRQRSPFECQGKSSSISLVITFVACIRTTITLLPLNCIGWLDVVADDRCPRASAMDVTPPPPRAVATVHRLSVIHSAI